MENVGRVGICEHLMINIFPGFPRHHGCLPVRAALLQAVKACQRSRGDESHCSPMIENACSSAQSGSCARSHKTSSVDKVAGLLLLDLVQIPE